MDQEHVDQDGAEKKVEEFARAKGEVASEGEGTQSVAAPEQRAGRRLSESDARTRQAMDRLPAVYAIHDAERRIQFINRFGLRLSGRAEAEILERRDEQVFPDEFTGCYLPILQRAYESGLHQHAQISLPDSFGARMVVLDCVPVHDQDGHVAQVVTVASDATRYKKIEHRLRDLIATLEQQVQQRTEQLRALAIEWSQAQEQERQRVAQELHENLQQALIAGQVQLGLGRQASGSKAWEFLDQVDHMLQDAIRISRDLTADLHPPIISDPDLSMSLEWLGHWMEEKHHLPVQATFGTKIDVPSDSLRTFLFRMAKDILLNVVQPANAPRAKLNVEQRDDEIWLTVQHPGDGVDLEQDPGSERALALASIRERIEYLGGHVDVVNTPGRGTKITLRLGSKSYEPETSSQPAPVEEIPIPVAAPSTPRIRVLIADDHRIVRQGLAMVLQNEADIAVVGEADNGQEALEMARRLGPDVVLMDMSMPLMDGVQATERIRQDLPDTHVIGLSMYTEKAMMARMRAAGVSAYVNKGGDPAELLRIVRKIVGGQST